MKIKFFSLFLALLLLISCSFDVSCSNTETDKETPTSTETSTGEEETLPPPIELADIDDLNYVMNSDNASYSVIGVAHESGAIRVEIPEAYGDLPITGIAASAFSSSAYLESVYMPDTVTHIGNSAFDGCHVLKSIELSDNLTFVGEMAFEGCESLDFNKFDNALYIGSESNPYMILIKATDTEIESCVVHDDTKFIYDYAFLECTEVDEVIVPEGLISVGSYAFEECYDLFPNNAHNGGYYLGNAGNPYVILVDTSGERDLEELAIEPTTKIIAPGALEGCSALTQIVIPESVSFIGQYAFEGCASLTQVVFERESCTVIDGEKPYAPLSIASSSDDIAKDLTTVYYYCAWYLQ